MDRVSVTSLSLALLFLCFALLVHSTCSTSLDDSEHELRERVRKAATDDEAKPARADTKQISENPYNRPNNFKLDMYRLLAIALFIGFAVVMYFVVWRFCSGPPA